MTEYLDKKIRSDEIKDDNLRISALHPIKDAKMR